MNFPDPNIVPDRKYRAEKYLLPDGTEGIRYIEDRECPPELEDAVYRFIYETHAT